MQTENNNPVVEEPIKKTSKLKKLGSNLIVAGAYAVPITITGAYCYYSYKILSTHLETAKLQLAAATEAAAQK